MYHLIIPKNTIVSSDKRGLVTLSDTVYVEAHREPDGGFTYAVSGVNYYVSAGTCRFIQI